MKKLIIIIAILLWASPALAIDVVCRIGHRYLTGHARHNGSWKDGHIVRIAPNGTVNGTRMLIDFVIVRLNDDYLTMRGSMDAKSTLPKVLEFKEWVNTKDSLGKYKWEVGSISSTTDVYVPPLRKRDWFIDFKGLLNSGYITQTDYDNIYNKKIKNKLFIINSTLEGVAKHEDVDTRLISNPTVSK